ncbi:MAG: fibronectin type III domain-containing protein, partial [Actinomycetota bacterium]
MKLWALLAFVMVAVVTVVPTGPADADISVAVSSEAVFSPPDGQAQPMLIDASRNGRWVVGYFETWSDNDLVDVLVSVDLASMEQRVVAEVPFGSIRRVIGVTDDGRVVVDELGTTRATIDLVSGERIELDAGETIDLRTGEVVVSDARRFRSSTRAGVVEADGQILVDGVVLVPDVAEIRGFQWSISGRFLAADGRRALAVVSGHLAEGPYATYLAEVEDDSSWQFVADIPNEPQGAEVFGPFLRLLGTSGELDRIVVERDFQSLRVVDLTSEEFLDLPASSGPAFLSEDGVTLVHEHNDRFVVTRLEPPTPLAEQVPNVVRNASAVGRDGSVDVVWEAPLGLVEPDDYVVTVTDLDTQGERSAVTSETSTAIDGLTNGTRYLVDVRARAGGGVGAPWTRIVVPNPPPVRLGVPTNLRAVVAGDEMTVTWGPPEDGGGFFGAELRWGDRRVSGSVFSPAVVEVEVGELPVVEVALLNGAGVGEFATTTAVVPDAPSQPRGLQVVAENDGTVIATWGAPRSDGGFDIEGYEVSVDGVSTTVDADATSASASGFAAGQVVRVEVRARNAIGLSPAARETATIPDVPPVDDPPADDPPVDDPPADDPPVDDPPADDPPVVDPPVVDDPPADDPPVVDPPVVDGPPVVDPPSGPVPAAVEPGYWMAERTGALYGFGVAEGFDGVGSRVVSVATDASGSGLWVVRADGVVETRGAAVHFGDVDLTV